MKSLRIMALIGLMLSTAVFSQVQTKQINPIQSLIDDARDLQKNFN
jgi:hypothetical protein